MFALCAVHITFDKNGNDFTTVGTYDACVYRRAVIGSRKL